MMCVLYHGQWMSGIKHIQQYAVHRTNNKIPTQVNNNIIWTERLCIPVGISLVVRILFIFYGRVMVVRESVLQPVLES